MLKVTVLFHSFVYCRELHTWIHVVGQLHTITTARCLPNFIRTRTYWPGLLNAKGKLEPSGTSQKTHPPSLWRSNSSIQLTEWYYACSKPPFLAMPAFGPQVFIFVHDWRRFVKSFWPLALAIDAVKRFEMEGNDINGCGLFDCSIELFVECVKGMLFNGIEDLECVT
jgi:hypothetical protein